MHSLLKFILFIWFNFRFTFSFCFDSIELVNLFILSAFIVNHITILCRKKGNNHRWYTLCIDWSNTFLLLDLEQNKNTNIFCKNWKKNSKSFIKSYFIQSHNMSYAKNSLRPRGMLKGEWNESLCHFYGFSLNDRFILDTLAI